MKKKLSMQAQESASVEERFQQFLSASAARGLSDKTLKTYKTHFHCISKHLDTAVSLTSLTKADMENMIAAMRASGLSANSISSYIRAFKSFLAWCNAEGYASSANVGAANVSVFVAGKTGVSGTGKTASFFLSISP